MRKVMQKNLRQKEHPLQDLFHMMEAQLLHLESPA